MDATFLEQSRESAAAKGDEAGEERGALPALAGGAAGWRRPSRRGARSHIVGASRRSVQYWCAAYARHRQKPPALALEEKPRLGRTPLFPVLNRERRLSEMAKDPLALGYAATNWTAPLRWPDTCHALARWPSTRTPCAAACARQDCVGSGLALSSPRPRPTWRKKRGADPPFEATAS